MKKYFGLLSCLLLLNACDDGDMALQTFNFSTATAADCGSAAVINTVFKINKNEALILKIDGDETLVNEDGIEYTVKNFPFRNQITAENTPKIFKISSTNKVSYRAFTGDVTATYFCQDIPPVSPSVVSETSTSENAGGTIEISTSIIPRDYTSIAQVEYNHNVMFKNITFSDNNGSTTYETFPFGSYAKKSNVSFSFAPATSPAQRCSDNTRLFLIEDRNAGNDPKRENLNEVLELTITNEELEGLQIGNNNLKIDETHRLTYRIFHSDVNLPFLCQQITTGLTPIPVTYATYNAEDGTDEIGNTPATGTLIIVKRAQQSPLTGYKYDFNFSNLKFKHSESITTFRKDSFSFSYVVN